MKSVGLVVSQVDASKVAAVDEKAAHRDQLLRMIVVEKERLASATGMIRDDIVAHISLLEQQVKALDQSVLFSPEPVSKPQSDCANALTDSYPKTESLPSTRRPKTRKKLMVPRDGALASGLKNYWYIVGFSSQLARGDLYPFELFEEQWVLFRDQAGKAACIKDECAHRACPLSLGKVVDGRVQCAYHGWEYATDGTCTHMPSCRQLRASVDSLACTEADGLLWVWPGDQQPTPLSNQVYSVPDGFQVHAELVMDLPVEHGLLMENLLDLAHAPFTHTGTFAKGWVPPELVRFVTPPKMSLAGNWDPYPIKMSFESPCYVLSTIGLRGQDCGRHLHQMHCCLPAGEGKTRLLYRLALDFWGWARLIPGKNWFWSRLAQKVIGEDLRLVLGQQERILAGGDVWQTPVGYDKLGVGYRRWRNQVENGSPEWSATTSSRSSSGQ